MSVTINRRPASGGFSLVEMMLAVAILALLGTTVVRVFLTADGMNRKAAELDRAVAFCTDAVERLKAENPSEPIGDALLTRVFPDADVTRQAAGWEVVLLADREWNLFTRVRSDLPAYRLVLDLAPDEASSGLTTAVNASLTVFPVPASIGESPGMAMARADGEESKAAVIFTLQAVLPAPCATEGGTP